MMNIKAYHGNEIYFLLFFKIIIVFEIILNPLKNICN